jgi:tRNA pseudouridine65 synthase
MAGLTMQSGLPMLYRDSHLVAVHKPSGLLVHRTNLDRHETRFAMQMVRDQLGCRVYPVHRLDKGTSGILLFALQPEVAQDLMRQFETQQVAKTYVAVVRGHPAERGEINHPLARIRDDYEWAGNDRASEAQAAVTRYRTLATAECAVCVDKYPTSRYALLELEPLTGRRHQLRRHLKHLSHPIIGDSTYGKGRHNRFFQSAFGCRRMLLASVSLQLAHPVTQQALSLVAPLADDFVPVLKSLGMLAQFPADFRL